MPKALLDHLSIVINHLPLDHLPMDRLFMNHLPMDHLSMDHLALKYLGITSMLSRLIIGGRAHPSHRQWARGGSVALGSADDIGANRMSNNKREDCKVVEEMMAQLHETSVCATKMDGLYEEQLLSPYAISPIGACQSFDT